jgi:hypothetical protein
VLRAHRRGHRAWDGAVARPTAATRWQGSRLEHHRPVTDAPGKKSGGGAHRGGGVTVGWRSQAWSMAFSGDGAGMVVADGQGIPLQLGGGGK